MIYPKNKKNNWKWTKKKLRIFGKITKYEKDNFLISIGFYAFSVSKQIEGRNGEIFIKQDEKYLKNLNNFK